MYRCLFFPPHLSSILVYPWHLYLDNSKTTETNMSKTEFMIVPPYLSVAEGNSGRIPLGICSPVAYMDCGVRLPSDGHQITEGNAKGNAFWAWKRMKQKIRCFWYLSYIFSPTPKGTSRRFLYMPDFLCLSAYFTSKGILSSTAGSWEGWRFNTSGATLNQ